MSITTLTCDAILFDMDGTLIDSTPGVLKAWEIFCKDYGLGDPTEIAHLAHGRRMYDTLTEFCHIDDEVKLEAETVRFEEEVIRGGPIALPGTLALLTELSSNTASAVWTIVTSASRNYALRALERCSVPIPSVGIVTSNDVTNGKPHPDPYLAGAQRCGADPTKCLVIEDAISGLKSGRAAGARVLAVCTSTSRRTILESDARPDYVVSDLTKVSVRRVDERLEITIDEISAE